MKGMNPVSSRLRMKPVPLRLLLMLLRPKPVSMRMERRSHRLIPGRLRIYLSSLRVELA